MPATGRVSWPCAGGAGGQAGGFGRFDKGRLLASCGVGRRGLALAFGAGERRLGALLSGTVFGVQRGDGSAKCRGAGGGIGGFAPRRRRVVDRRSAAGGGNLHLLVERLGLGLLRCFRRGQAGGLGLQDARGLSCVRLVLPQGRSFSLDLAGQALQHQQTTHRIFRGAWGGQQGFGRIQRQPLDHRQERCQRRGLSAQAFVLLLTLPGQRVHAAGDREGRGFGRAQPADRVGAGCGQTLFLGRSSRGARRGLTLRGKAADTRVLGVL